MGHVSRTPTEPDSKTKRPTKGSRRGWVARLGVLLLVLFLLALATARARLDPWARGRIVDELAKAVDGTATLADLDLDLWRLTAEFRELSVHGHDGRLVLEVDAGFVRMPWSKLLGLRQGRIRIEELRLDRPFVRIEQPVDETPKTGPLPELDLEIARLAIQSGRMVYGNQEIKLDFTVDEFSLDGRWEGEALVGRTRFASVVDRAPLSGWPVAVECGVRWHSSRIELFDVRASGPGISAESDVDFVVARPAEIEGSIRIDANLGKLRPYLAPTVPVVAGTARVELEFRSGSSPAATWGRFTGREVQFGPLEFSKVSGALKFAGGLLTLGGIEGESLGGVVEGDVRLASGEDGRFSVHASGRDLDSQSVFRLLNQSYPFAGRVEAELDLDGVPGLLTTWLGKGSFKVRPDFSDAGRLPIGGRGEFTLDAGRLEVIAPVLETSATRLSVGLEADLSQSPADGFLELSGVTHDARETQRGVCRLLAEMTLLTASPMCDPLYGYGDIRATIGFGDSTLLRIGLELQSGGWREQVFDRASLDVTLNDEDVLLDELVVVNGDERLEATGWLKLDPPAVDALNVEMQGVNARRLLEWVLPDLDADGRISGAIELHRGEQGLEGEGAFAIVDGRFLDEPFEAVVRDLDFTENRIERARVDIVGPAVDAHGTLTLDITESSATITLEPSRFQMDQLRALVRSGFPLHGEMTTSGRVGFRDGTAEGRFEISGKDWRIQGQPLGRVSGSIELVGQGLRAELTSSDDESWRVGGNWDWGGDGPFSVDVELADARVSEVMADRLAVDARITGKFEVVGETSRPERTRLNGNVEQVRVRVGSHRLSLGAPAELNWSEGLLTFGPTTIEGAATRLDAELRYDTRSGEVELSGQGDVDIALVTTVLPDCRGSGSARIDLRMEGSIDRPSMHGTVEVEHGRVRWFGFPQTLEQIKLTARFEGDELVIPRAEALVGGGELVGSGWVRLDGLALDSYRFELAASSVRLAFPEDVQAAYDAQLVFSGDLDEGTIAGNLAVLRALYAKDFDVGGIMGTTGREYESAGRSRDEGYPLNLDLTVFADGNLWVRNRLAQVESEMALQIQGTAERPEVTGRVTVLPGGKLEFRDVKYDVEFGSLDFVEIERIDPYLSFRAKTTVQEYEILLRVDGKIDSFTYQLTSNPTLPSQDIISLLTTGYTLQDLTKRHGGTGAAFTGDLAANYFTGALTGGLQRQLEDVLGLDRVQINPLLVEGNADPTARVTVGKEVSDDLFVIYSQTLGSTEQQIYRVEWQASRRIRFSAERDQFGAVGGDVQYTERFWWTVPKDARGSIRVDHGPVSDTPQTETGAGATVGEVTLVGLDEKRADELLHRLPLKEGRAFTRAEMFRGVENLRRVLVHEGRIRADVRARADENADGSLTTPVRVTYTVDVGPKIAVDFEGVKKREEKKIRARLETMWVESLFEGDLFQDSVREIQRFFSERGYYAVDVLGRRGANDEGPTVTFVVDRGKSVTVDLIVIEGASSVPPERVRRQMLTREPGVFSRRTLKPRVLEEDLGAILNMYRDLGHLETTVDPPRVRLSKEGDSAEIKLVIHEGPRFVVSEVEFPGELPFERTQLLAWSGLEVGAFFSPTELLEAESALRAGIDERGYPDVRVRARVRLDENRTQVRFEIDAGGRKEVAEIVVSGNGFTKSRVVRREVELDPGDLISRSELLQTQHRLYRLGIFRSVRLEYSPLEGDPTRQRLDVHVEEARPLSLVVGGGFDSEGGPRGRFSLTHENLGGWDRRLSLQGRAGGIHDRLAIVLEDERLFGRRLPMILNLSIEKRQEVGFSFSRRGGALRLDRRFSQHWSAFTRYNLEDVKLFDVDDALAPPEDRLETVRLGSVGVTFRLETRDDPFVPTRGSAMNVGFSVFSEPLLSERSFVKWGVNYSHIWQLPHHTNFVTSVRLGVASTFGDTSDVPLSERYFAGGDQTVRGFPRDQLGPTLGPEQGNIPKGGESSLIFNQEFRFPIWRSLRGVAFYDAGNVYEFLEDFDVTDLRHVLGGGFRLVTPIGPIRLEYGSKLDRRPGESSGELFLSIGAPF